MNPQHDLIAFYRHVLRSGDVALARRLTRALRADPRYRFRADELLRGLPPASGSRSTVSGRLLDDLLAGINPQGDT